MVKIEKQLIAYSIIMMFLFFLVIARVTTKEIENASFGELYAAVIFGISSIGYMVIARLENKKNKIKP